MELAPAPRSNAAPQGAVAVKLGEHLAGLITFASVSATPVWNDTV